MLKKRFNFVAVVLAAVTFIGLSSCKDEVYYSCDPTIDAVIKQNLPYYEEMTRAKWKTIPDSLRKAAFAAMKPELKKEFWRGKQEEMMNSHIFKDAEKEHISKLYNYLLSIDDLFTGKYKEGSKEMQKLIEYYKEWAFYGVDSLNWDVIDIVLIAEDGEELIEDYIYYVKQNAATNNSTLQHEGSGNNGSKPNCNCTWDGGCMGLGSCNNPDCTKVSWGCKFLYMGECTKRCKDPIVINGQVVNVIEYSSQRGLLEYMFEKY